LSRVSSKRSWIVAPLLPPAPPQPKLFLEYLDHFEKVNHSTFIRRPWPAVTRSGAEIGLPGERRAEVTSILRRQNIDLGAGAETLFNLDRLEESAVAVVSGQQVGLFSGPAYSVYKALTAVQIAEELTRAEFLRCGFLDGDGRP